MRGNPLTLIGPELKPGDKAPDFKLVDNSLKDVRLADTGGQVRIISVVPSLDTPVCDAQTKRFNEEAAKLPGVDIYTVSMDLPFAQARWCAAAAVQHTTLSAHKSEDFGRAYGVLIQQWRLLQRAVFVVDRDGRIVYADYVPDQTAEPDYAVAIAAVKATTT